MNLNDIITSFSVLRRLDLRKEAGLDEFDLRPSLFSGLELRLRLVLLPLLGVPSLALLGLEGNRGGGVEEGVLILFSLQRNLS